MPVLAEAEVTTVMSITLSVRALAAPLVALGLMAGASPVPAQNPSTPGTFTPDQVQAIQEIVREVLVNDPEIILRAIEEIRSQQERHADDQAREAIARYSDMLLNDPSSPTTGNPRGDVVVVEFFDYQCPYCKRTTTEVRRLIGDDRNLKVVFKELPILGPASITAARAALAAHRQGKYLAFHFALMKVSGKLSEAAILQTAAEVGIDVKRLREDMRNPRIKAMIRANLELAKRLGINGTPAFVIGDQMIPGAVDFAALKRMVAAARRG